MSDVIRLKHLQKFVVPPTGEECILVWARKVFPDKNIYELSMERLDGGYTMWYTRVVEGEFEFISCSLYGSIETLAIKAAEEELNAK